MNESIIQWFMIWLNQQRKEVLGGNVYYDVEKYYKRIPENEIFGFYLKHIIKVT